MEILSPSPPPSPARNQFVYGGAGALLRRDQAGAGALLHVAVGRSPEKTLPLLRWAFRRFACARVALVHVHQPSPVIPTLLGKIPAAQATEELVLSHRRSERDERNRILLAYLAFCQRAQVQATVLVTENEQINDGIVALVRDHGVTKLVMGSIPDNCFKLKAGHNKEYFMAKNAPAFCEIWFVWRGRHIWTREASAAIGNSISIYNQDDTMMTRKRTRFSPNSNDAEPVLAEGTESDNGRVNHYGALGADASRFYNMRISNLHDAESAFNSTLWPDSSVLGGALQLHSKVALLLHFYFTSFVLGVDLTVLKLKVNDIYQEMLDANLKQVMVEAEGSRKEAFLELLRRKEIESKVASAFVRVKASESSKKREMKIREELEGLFVAARKQHEDLARSKEKATAVLDSSMRRLDILDARAKNMSLRMDEAVAELEVIQSSINILKQERSKAHKKEDRHTNHVKEGCTYSHSKLPNCSSIALGDDPYTYRQLTLLDVQAATCKFSESFKLRPRGHGCIYKGKNMNRSVMIHRLHSDSKSSMQFQRKVYILNKVRHPHLVTLVGVCPEALCLAYEYPKNGSLHDHLFGELNSAPPLPWKIRARVVAEISSALLFLHSCKPQVMVHGGLNLENVLLDSDFHCKIADFGTLTEEDSKDHPALDSRLLAHKSDINSFGTVIMQLLTGKQAGSPGLASEVRRALSCGKLSSILDPMAGEWPMEAARRLAEFGLECIGDRPELTPDTVRELEQLHLIRGRQVPSFFLCPILKQTMDDPQVAADGVTYEGRAIREWIEDGRAVADLKLKHLDLTPNHALRFAIQDWLSQPQW
ncbi:U-box domain-containing protein 33 isoform X1 [Triticum aestivum]|nr:U-box domain-containing protein 33-like isoform X1 [Triticum aestivum]